MSGYNITTNPKNFNEKPIFAKTAPNGEFSRLTVTEQFIAPEINTLNTRVDQVNTRVDQVNTSVTLLSTELRAKDNYLEDQINTLNGVDSTTVRIMFDQFDAYNFTLYGAQATGIFGIPTAPVITAVNVIPEGINVAFNPVYSSPPVKYYLLSAGQSGACVTIESRYATGATIPVLTGQTTAQVSVVAVSDYGTSTKRIWPSVLTGANLAAAIPNPNIKMVQVLEFSDFHGAIEGVVGSSIGAALLKSAFDRDRTFVPSTFTVSAGDNFGASPPISGEFFEIPTVECMNLMNVDVSTFGNHEHDRKIGHLQDMIGRSNFKWTACNYDTLTLLASGANQSTEYVICETGGMKVGFVGFNNPDTKLTTAPGNLDYATGSGTGTLNIYSDVNMIINACEKVKRAGAELVVCLLHVGWVANLNARAYGDLVDYAKNIEGADVIFGAHSHQSYRSVFKGDAFNLFKLIGQTTNAGVQYNRALIAYDKSTKKVIGSTMDTLSYSDVSSLTPNPTIAALVQNYKNLLGPKFDVKLNLVNRQFPGGGGISDRIDRRQEGYIGDFITDLMRARFNTTFAMVNGGGIRDTIPALTYLPNTSGLLRPSGSGGQDQIGPFDVVVGDIYTVFPFGNAVTIVTVTGKTIWDCIKWGVTGWPSNGKFPQVSGFYYSFSSTLKTVFKIWRYVNGVYTEIPNSTATSYTLAIPDYMLYGGDGYTFFDPTKATFTGILLADILKQKFIDDKAANITTVRPALDGRIVVLP